MSDARAKRTCGAARAVAPHRWSARRSSFRWGALLGAVVLMASVLGVSAPTSTAQAAPCEHWVAPAPSGDDANPGSFASPWATLAHAAATVADVGCTVWVLDGTYTGPTEITRRFTTLTTFRAANPYMAVLQAASTVVWLNGARNVAFQGFEMRHTGPGAVGYLVYVDSHNGVAAESIVVRDNILHDTFGNDIVKLNEVSHFVTIEGNIFYNQVASEQHIDVNSVTDVVIQDNVFFNDYARSGRPAANDAKHFIVVKDSNEALDGLTGSERITIRRNVFMNWQGIRDTFVQIGNDGKPYHEAKDVRVENNLMLGNSPVEADEAFGVAGARDVVFDSNTVVGDLPSSAYAFSVGIKVLNPTNENIRFVNNIWSDPTGTMGAGAAPGSNEFSNGDPAATLGLVLDNNLYWNGGAAIPPGGLVSPLVADARRTVANPGLNVDQSAIVVPFWNGATFLSGSTTARQEFVRLVQTYGSIPPGSPAVGRADPSLTPAEDILGVTRDGQPDLGAYENATQPTPPAAPTGLVVTDPAIGGRLDLSWNANTESDLAGYNVYRATQPSTARPWTRVNTTLLTGTTLTDGGLTDGVPYWYYVTAVDTAQSEGIGSAAATGTPTAPATVVLDVRVAASSDDAEESATGSVSLTSSDLELVNDGSNQTVGVRFAGLDVPRGATITKAYIQFEVDEVTTGPASLLVQGQASDAAATFTTSTANVSSRPRTTRSVTWVPAAWPTVQVRGPDQRTPDLSPVLKEIIDRPGWARGNALVLILTGTDRRTAEAVDGTAGPVLHVEYRTVATANQPPTFDQDVTDRTEAEGTAVSLDAGATDPDGDPLIYEATGLPPGLSINAGTGMIGGTIGVGAAAGSPYPVSVTVRDGPAVDATDTFTWRVNPTVPPPSGLAYLSMGSGGTVAGVSFADEDILTLNGSTFALLFDGSDVGLSGDVDAVLVEDATHLLLSVDADTTLPGIGAVDDSDVLRFTATSFGPTTAGSFEFVFDGSDVGLTASSEDVDALERLADGRLLLSTTGSVSATGLSGSFADEDLLAFTPTTLGATTAGSWALYFDGSDVGLGANDIDALGVAADGTLKISLTDPFSTTGLATDDEDVFTCEATQLGATTACAFVGALVFDGSTFGLASNDLDAFDPT